MTPEAFAIAFSTVQSFTTHVQRVAKMKQFPDEDPDSLYPNTLRYSRVDGDKVCFFHGGTPVDIPATSFYGAELDKIVANHLRSRKAFLAAKAKMATQNFAHVLAEMGYGDAKQTASFIDTFVKSLEVPQ